MEKNLKLLSSKLKEYGEHQASLSVDELIKSISEIHNVSLTKTSNMAEFVDTIDTGVVGGLAASVNQSSQPSGGMASFIDGTQEPGTDVAAIAETPEFKSWAKILNDYDKVPNQVEKFHEIHEKVTKTVLSPLKGHQKDLQGQGAPEPTEAARNAVAFKLKEGGRAVRTTMEMSERMEDKFKVASQAYISSKKIASPDNYLNSYLTSLAIMDLNSNEFGITSFAKTDADLTRMQSMIDQAERGVLQHSDAITGQTRWGAAAGAGNLASKVKPGYFGRGMAIVGILFSGPLLVKNVIEAWNNGKTIVYELPLEKYGISKGAALTGLGAGKILGQVRKSIRENKENPDALYEILEIAKTISAYWLDVVFAVTNALMAIIDILTIIVAFIDGPLPIADAAAGGIGMLLSFGLMGLEFGTESLVNNYWNAQKEKIKAIAEKKIAKMAGGEDQPSVISGAEAPTVTSDTFQVAASLAG